MSDGLAGERPYGFEVLPLTRIEARLVAYDWAWARDNAERVAANWERRRAARPGLFDGPVLMVCACAVTDGHCRVDFFETRYSCFIAYRDGGSPDGHVANGFAAIVPWSADGAVLLGEMGGATANAGQVYFACGTPDRDDVRGETVDLAGSAGRELGEETGLALPPDAGEAWVLLRGDGQLAFLRPVRFGDPAETLHARMEAHRRADPDPELARFVVARGLSDIDPGRMPPFVRAYLASAFADGPAPAVTP